MLNRHYAIPHEYYILTLLMMGIPAISRTFDITTVKSVRDYCVEESFNDLPEKDYQAYEEICKTHPKLKGMYNANRKIFDDNQAAAYDKRKPLILVNDALDFFPCNHIFKAFVNMYSYNVKPLKAQALLRMNNILKATSDRTFVELCIIHGLGVVDIARYLAKKNLYTMYNRYKQEDIQAYMTYYWNVTPQTLFIKRKMTTALIEYLLLDKSNKFYADHKHYAKSSEERLLLYIGNVTKDHRHQTTKDIYGKTALHIIDKLETGKPINFDRQSLYMHADKMLAEVESSKDAGIDYAKMLTERFLKVDNRASRRKMNWDDINNNEGKPEPVVIELPEQDAPATTHRQ